MFTLSTSTSVKTCPLKCYLLCCLYQFIFAICLPSRALASGREWSCDKRFQSLPCGHRSFLKRCSKCMCRLRSFSLNFLKKESLYVASVHCNASISPPLCHLGCLIIAFQKQSTASAPTPPPVPPRCLHLLHLLLLLSHFQRKLSHRVLTGQ